MKLSKLFPAPLRTAIANLSIAKKIGYSYAVAIAIALMGSAIGVEVGNFYQERARQHSAIVDEQQHLLDALNILILEIHFHPQNLLAVLDDPVWIEYEKSQFRQSLLQLEKTLLELKTFIRDRSQQLSVDMVEFESSLESYHQALENHDILTRELWRKIDSIDPQPETVDAIEQQVLEAIRGQDALQLLAEFEKLSKHLNEIKQVSKRQSEQAKYKLERAKLLRVQIIAASIFLSSAIAILLAIVTSRAIARPLKSVTAIAREVAEKGDFDLRSPVFSRDEIGILAKSLNQLIQWAQNYAWEIEFARLTLENRVEERTQELQEALENLQQTQAQLIQSEKMSSLGQLVAGVAHEINNPVSFIYGNLVHLEEHANDLSMVIDSYQKHYPDNPPELEDILSEVDIDFIQDDLPQLLYSMKVGADRIKAIVLSLRNFSRLDEAEKKDADLREGLDSTLLILNHKLNDQIQIVKNYSNISPVVCYPAQLNQVFMNILTNAIDALTECDRWPKEITITIQQLDNWVRIKIGDNGPGIEPEIRDRIFNPFFTTKPIGTGTGLGLSVSYQIVVDKHKGRLSCSSIVGKGTTFIVEIPIAT